MERNTRQRYAIQKAIDHASRPLSPQEILEAAQAEVPGLGIATVYRNLKTLLEGRAIEIVVLPGDSPRYESRQAASQHHHHFQCRVCSKVYDVPGCVSGYEQLAPAGFTVENHEMTLYGVCAACDPRDHTQQPSASRTVPHQHQADDLHGAVIPIKGA
jgi:Fur family ferric uptake transcriptional regulator